MIGYSFKSGAKIPLPVLARVFFLTLIELFSKQSNNGTSKGDVIKGMNKKAKRFCNMRHDLEMIYDNYARSMGISYMTLFVLNLISQYEVCTQKIICERTMLPKQTVNNVVKKLTEQGYLRLEEIPGNSKSKRILYTEKGKEYAEPMIKHVQDAEDTAMEQLSEIHQEELFCIMELYDLAFRKAMDDK